MKNYSKRSVGSSSSIQIVCSILRNLQEGSHNLDENGYPKKTSYNGVERTKMSPQNRKRGVREQYCKNDSIRTRRFNQLILEYVNEVDDGITLDDVKKIMDSAAPNSNKEKSGERKKEDKGVLFFHAISSAPQIAGIICQDIEAIRKNIKSDMTEMSKKILDIIQQNITDEIAMFGRMCAAKPEFNIGAAMSVSSAMSTHKAHIIDDYYSAKDDFVVGSDAGAGMIGYKYTHSSCMYESYVIDFDVLVENLSGNKEKAEKAVRNVVKAMIFNYPSTGIHNSASFSPAALCLVSIGNFSPVTMAPAFADPVKDNYIKESIKRLNDYCPRYFEKFLFEDESVDHICFGSESFEGLDFLSDCEQPNINSFIEKIKKSL